MVAEWLFCEEPAIRSNPFVVKLRLWVFGVAWLHLCITALIFIPQDMSQDEDPKIQVYAWLKWWFITAWFNLINLAYIPLCLYCDWKESKGEQNEVLVGKARRIRDVMFTSILFPTIMWADTFFWRLYLRDKTLIAPSNLFEYTTTFSQHSLHSVSLVVAVIDLLIIPRRKPVSVKPRLKLMTAFYFVYVIAVMERYKKGELVYSFLGLLSGLEIIILAMLCYLEYLLYFSIQWLVIGYLYKRRPVAKKIL